MAAVPRVSVVVPAFENASYIRATVASVLAQTYPDFELVVADHSSSDGTWEILQEFAGDPRVRLLRTPAGGGAVRNWNRVTAGGPGRAGQAGLRRRPAGARGLGETGRDLRRARHHGRQHPWRRGGDGRLGPRHRRRLWTSWSSGATASVGCPGECRGATPSVGRSCMGRTSSASRAACCCGGRCSTRSAAGTATPAT